MRYLIYFFLIFVPCTIQANEPKTVMKNCETFVGGMTQSEQVKETLAQKERALALAHSAEAQSRLHFELALAYYRDQELDSAFSHFLEALKKAPKGLSNAFKEGEQELYEKALGEYLAHDVSDPIQVANNLLQKYGAIADANRDYVYLNFVIATAYANVGRFDDFFDRFYQGYPYLHDTFLAAKTEGILYLRLSHHGKLPEQRRCYQKEAGHALSLALQRNPQDAGLYKVLLFLAKDEKNEGLVHSYLQKLVDNRVELPRADIFFYVREAVLLGNLELGQKIIDRAREIYNYSRAIVDSQEYLNQHRLR